VKGERRLKELKELSKASTVFGTFATYENPYQDEITHVFLIETDGTITNIVITQHINNYVNGKETFSEIWLSPKDFQNIAEWISKTLTLYSEGENREDVENRM